MSATTQKLSTLINSLIQPSANHQSGDSIMNSSHEAEQFRQLYELLMKSMIINDNIVADPRLRRYLIDRLSNYPDEDMYEGLNTDKTSVLAYSAEFKFFCVQFSSRSFFLLLKSVSIFLTSTMKRIDMIYRNTDELNDILKTELDTIFILLLVVWTFYDAIPDYFRFIVHSGIIDLCIVCLRKVIIPYYLRSTSYAHVLGHQTDFTMYSLNESINSGSRGYGDTEYAVLYSLYNPTSPVVLSMSIIFYFFRLVVHSCPSELFSKNLIKLFLSVLSVNMNVSFLTDKSAHVPNSTLNEQKCSLSSLKRRKKRSHTFSMHTPNFVSFYSIISLKRRVYALVLCAISSVKCAANVSKTDHVSDQQPDGALPRSGMSTGYNYIDNDRDGILDHTTQLLMSIILSILARSSHLCKSIPKTGKSENMTSDFGYWSDMDLLTLNEEIKLIRASIEAFIARWMIPILHAPRQPVFLRNFLKYPSLLFDQSFDGSLTDVSGDSSYPLDPGSSTGSSNTNPFFPNERSSPRQPGKTSTKQFPKSSTSSSTGWNPVNPFTNIFFNINSQIHASKDNYIRLFYRFFPKFILASGMNDVEAMSKLFLILWNGVPFIFMAGGSYGTDFMNEDLSKICDVEDSSRCPYSLTHYYFLLTRNILYVLLASVVFAPDLILPVLLELKIFKYFNVVFSSVLSKSHDITLSAYAHMDVGCVPSAFNDFTDENNIYKGPDEDVYQTSNKYPNDNLCVSLACGCISLMGVMISSALSSSNDNMKDTITDAISLRMLHDLLDLTYDISGPSLGNFDNSQGTIFTIHVLSYDARFILAEIISHISDKFDDSKLIDHVVSTSCFDVFGPPVLLRMPNISYVDAFVGEHSDLRFLFCFFAANFLSSAFPYTCTVHVPKIILINLWSDLKVSSTSDYAFGSLFIDLTTVASDVCGSENAPLEVRHCSLKSLWNSEEIVSSVFAYHFLLLIHKICSIDSQRVEILTDIQSDSFSNCIGSFVPSQCTKHTASQLTLSSFVNFMNSPIFFNALGFRRATTTNAREHSDNITDTVPIVNENTCRKTLHAILNYKTTFGQSVPETYLIKKHLPLEKSFTISSSDKISSFSEVSKDFRMGISTNSNRSMLMTNYFHAPCWSLVYEPSFLIQQFDIVSVCLLTQSVGQIYRSSRQISNLFDQNCSLELLTLINSLPVLLLLLNFNSFSFIPANSAVYAYAMNISAFSHLSLAGMTEFLTQIVGMCGRHIDTGGLAEDTKYMSQSDNKPAPATLLRANNKTFRDTAWVRRSKLLFGTLARKTQLITQQKGSMISSRNKSIQTSVPGGSKNYILLHISKILSTIYGLFTHYTCTAKQGEEYIYSPLLGYYVQMEAYCSPCNRELDYIHHVIDDQSHANSSSNTKTTRSRSTVSEYYTSRIYGFHSSYLMSPEDVGKFLLEDMLSVDSFVYHFVNFQRFNYFPFKKYLFYSKFINNPYHSFVYIFELLLKFDRSPRFSREIGNIYSRLKTNLWRTVNVSDFLLAANIDHPNSKQKSVADLNLSSKALLVFVKTVISVRRYKFIKFSRPKREIPLFTIKVFVPLLREIDEKIRPFSHSSGAQFNSAGSFNIEYSSITEEMSRCCMNRTEKPAKTLDIKSWKSLEESDFATENTPNKLLIAVGMLVGRLIIDGIKIGLTPRYENTDEVFKTNEHISKYLLELSDIFEDFRDGMCEYISFTLVRSMFSPNEFHRLLFG